MFKWVGQGTADVSILMSETGCRMTDLTLWGFQISKQYRFEIWNLESLVLKFNAIAQNGNDSQLFFLQNFFLQMVVVEKASVLLIASILNVQRKGVVSTSPVPFEIQTGIQTKIGGTF